MSIESSADFKRNSVEPLVCVKAGWNRVDAARLSTRAGFANFRQVVGLLVLNALLALAGALFCYVGLFLVLPVSFASTSIAYDQVFGFGRAQSALSLTPAAPIYR